LITGTGIGPSVADRGAALPPEKGSAIVPFRKFILTPEQVEPMRQAFNKLCHALDLNWQPDDPATDLIAEKIVEVAATGELDPDIICAKVLGSIKGPTGSQSPA
jgi:hypothetical protein